MPPDTQSGPRSSVEHFYVELIAEKLARAALGDVDLVFSFDVRPAERARLREIARWALKAAREGTL